MGALLLLKVSLLLSVTLVAARLLGRAPAVTRHRLWSLAFAAVLALPPLAAALPALYVPVPSGWEAAASVRMTSGAVRGPAGARDQSVIVSTGHRSDANAPMIGERTLASSDPLPAAQPDGPRSASLAAVGPSASTLLLAAWLTGTTAAAAAVFLSLLRVRRLVRRAEDVCDPAWRRAATTIGAQLGLRSPARLLLSPSVGTPMAGGSWRHVIFLPLSARAWSAEYRDVVLAHELAHLAGRDPLRHLVTRLALACYWFHPLAWIGARQAAAAREQACDETVIALGTRPSTYARVLLDLAESMNPPARLLGALPMVHRSHLERRLMAILNVDVRPATRRLVFGPAIGVALLTLSVAAAQPFDQTQGRSLDEARGRPEVSSSLPMIAPVVEPPAVAVIIAPSAEAPVVAAATVRSAPAKAPATGAQADPARDSACWSDAGFGSSFSGSTSISEVGGRMVIREQVGWRGGDRVIQKTFGDLRLCMLVEDAGDHTPADRPSQWVGRARRVVLEARRGNAVHRLEVSGPATGDARTSWQIGGVTRAFDAAAQEWRDRMLAVLDTTWELSSLRGEVSSLRGQISSIQGQRSSLRGEISSLRGEVSSMNGRASSIQGEQSSLRGRISSIQGHVSSLRGRISSAQGAISSLNATRYGVDAGERSRIAGHDVEIARLEREIGDYGADARIAAVEREIAALDARGRVAAIDAQVRAFDLDGKIAGVERRIAALDVEGRIAAIERQIEALDADRRARQLEERRDAELTRLDAAITAIR